ANVLSALGIGGADRLEIQRASLQIPLTEAALMTARARLAELETQARAELAAFGENATDIRVDYALELRAGDSETSLSVRSAPLEEVLSAFAAAHLPRFGF